MSDRFLAENCAPTLAGLKTGNLFSCEAGDVAELRREIRRLNRILTKKGMRIIPMRIRRGRALLYLYRPERLSHDIHCQEVLTILREQGYTCANADRLVAELVSRLQSRREFPHEIGLFLGYPAADVRGFMRHSREGVKLTGYWKVYGDSKAAAHIFDGYRRCTALWCRAIENGCSLEQLIR